MCNVSRSMPHNYTFNETCVETLAYCESIAPRNGILLLMNSSYFRLQVMEIDDEWWRN